MIEQVDDRLKKWITPLVGETAVSFSPPKPTTGRGVSLYLLELVDFPPLRGPKKPPLQLLLRYLVTTWGETPAEAHQLLGHLLFSAMQTHDFETQLQSIDPAVWVAFGTPPLPAFMLCVPLKLEQPEKLAPLVRSPIEVVGSPMTQLNGVVLGPGNIPIANALIEYPALQRSVHTDHKGRFRFTAVPSKPREKLLHIKARGKEFEITVEQPSQKGERIIIDFDPLDLF